METNTEIILRPFNFGATQSYTDHTGLGKNTNVKGKSCYLNDTSLNEKITYIQSNAYTGRNQKAEKENTIVASSKASTALDKQKPKLTSVASTGALRALPTQPMTQN